MIAGISAHEASDLPASGQAAAVDVRELSEWRQGHIANAVHIPLGEPGSRLDELPQGRRIGAV